MEEKVGVRRGNEKKLNLVLVRRNCIEKERESVREGGEERRREGGEEGGREGGEEGETDRRGNTLCSGELYLKLLETTAFTEQRFEIKTRPD